MTQSRSFLVPVERSSLPGKNSVARAFDSIAGSFDGTLENEITVRIRQKVYSIIKGLVSPGSSILDVNCGTGIDLLNLSGEGYRVAGVDISEGMISTARRKLDAAGKADVPLSVCSFDRLDRSKFRSYDLVLSNFGGLNCTPSLDAAAESIATVTRKGGYFVGIIMPPFSLWETVSFLGHFRWRDAFRRMRPSAPATGFPGSTFRVYYHSPRAVVRAFSPSFEAMQTTGLSIISPNPQSKQFVLTHPHFDRFLARLDTFVENIPILRSIGDHYVIVFLKK